MKAQVIPAQITTVEDRIAGSFSLTQIMLLLSPVFFASFVFALIPPTMHLVSYKILLCLGFALIAITLSIRVKEKLVIHWIGVLLRFNLRPKFYIFNKNDHFMRKNEVVNKTVEVSSATNTKKDVRHHKSFDVANLVKLDEFLNSSNSQIRFMPNRKGGLHVALEKVKQKG